MYRFLDQPLSTLDNGGQFAVRAVRNWVGAVADRKCPADAITPLFLDRRMIGALAPFHRALTILAVHSKMQIGFAKPCCPVVAEGEALLLSLLDRENDRKQTCAAVVSATQAEPLMQAILELEAAMQLVGLAPGSPGASPTRP